MEVHRVEKGVKIVLISFLLYKHLIISRHPLIELGATCFLVSANLTFGFGSLVL